MKDDRKKQEEICCIQYIILFVELKIRNTSVLSYIHFKKGKSQRSKGYFPKENVFIPLFQAKKIEIHSKMKNFEKKFDLKKMSCTMYTLFT